MKRLCIWLCVFIVLLLLTASPMLAQDDDPPDIVPAEEVAPTEAIVVEAPATTPVMADESSEETSFIIQALLVIVVVQFLVIALLAWRIAGSIPPELITLLFDTATNVARLTPSPSDDQRITELRDLVTRYLIPPQAMQRASPDSVAVSGDKPTVNVFVEEVAPAPVEG